MKLRLTPMGRRRLFGVVVVAIFALVATGVSQGSASSSSAVSPIRYHRDKCAAPSDKKSVGRATFTKEGTIVTLNVSLHGADPGDYQLYLFTPHCDNIWSLGKFKVDASGDGSKAGSADVSGYGNSFFADAYSVTDDLDNESDIVKL
jgi:hypothetical protein